MPLAAAAALWVAVVVSLHVHLHLFLALCVELSHLPMHAGDPTSAAHMTRTSPGCCLFLVIYLWLYWRASMLHHTEGCLRQLKVGVASHGGEVVG